MGVCVLSVQSLFVTPWTPLSVEFPRQEYCSGLPFPSPGDCPNPGIKPESPALLGEFFTTAVHGKPPYSKGVIVSGSLSSVSKWSS